MSPLMIPQLPGNAGVRQTLSTMAALVNASITDPLIRDQAARVIGACPRGDQICQCYALLAWVKRTMHYVPDPTKGPTKVEALHDPKLIARAIHEQRYVYGDCDDFSMYLAALMKSIGLFPRFRAVGYNGQNYQHVYVMCQNLKLDATRDEWTALVPSMHQETSAMEQTI